MRKQWERAQRSRGRQNHFVVSDPRRTKACVGDKSLRQNGTDRVEKSGAWTLREREAGAKGERHIYCRTKCTLIFICTHTHGRPVPDTEIFGGSVCELGGGVMRQLKEP